MNTLKIIENELIEVGINPCLSGFYCLLHSINYFLENKKEFYEVSVTKELYPYVATKINYKTASRVERCIRHSIEKLYNETYTEHLGHVINLNSGKPTNATFIAYMLLRVKNKINDGVD